MSNLLCKSFRVVGMSFCRREKLVSLLLAKHKTNNIITQSLASSARSISYVVNNSAKAGTQPGLGCFRLQHAFISTSNKKPDGSSITADVTTTTTTTTPATTESTETLVVPKRRTWRSYGFDFQDEDKDRTYANGVFFWVITVGMVATGFVCAYYPDMKFAEWGQREAYIELARREALGLPLVDPDLIPADKFELPTEEELGDFEIKI